ncbi:hypothetical protein ETD85_32465 [Nonomuraea zeae]|uniref:ImmA/IrrE family metallo-endopeptidase n=2 Tax=Nonomuraea zeae TaxID=1642303 RepID=A0A5S4G8V6_9ACTN|nr:hypothetical protein ETD85_32465 [Nonomuraea zeae]
MSAVPFRRLRRSCEARLDKLPLPQPFTAEALCAQVAAQRGRPIRLVPMARGAGVCGMWVSAGDCDLIFYEQATTSPHQQHIILHELSHLMCDHYPAGLPHPDQWRHLLPDLDPQMVHRVLGRTTYSAIEEQEAELLASLIQARAGKLAALEVVAETNALTGRIRALLDWSGSGRPERPS